MFRAPDGLEFDAAIEAPPESRRNGWGVVMIGGGYGNDLDWTVPGRIVVDGGATTFTLTGEPHADAPPISAALAARGFVVMRWSTIARGDPLRDQWPQRATPRTPAVMLEHARTALASFREAGLVKPDHVILLGHSLGAARACTIAADDPGVRGLILLSPAYFAGDAAAAAKSLDRNGMRFGEAVLRARHIPCLAVFGGLDRSPVVDAYAAAALAASGGVSGLEVRVLPGIGHQLGPERDGMFGPIDPAVPSLIADWADATRAGTSNP